VPRVEPVAQRAENQPGRDSAALTERPLTPAAVRGTARRAALHRSTAPRCTARRAALHRD
jgi:hypothetical protein